MSHLHVVHSDAGPDHQRRVDAIQAQIRSEIAARGGPAAPPRPSIFKAPPPRPAASSSQLDLRLAEELDHAVRKLEHLGGALAANPILLQRHAAELQSIDLIKQVIGHIARVVEAEDEEWAVELITLQDLRSRLQRKAIRPLGG
ncbi:MAG TPA: hypothetical protein VEW04_02955 [Allosphingosinicella sp.]|nr:hypothetical protein [Allosphingosinicella sp.]